jgi:hypothetical protein
MTLSSNAALAAPRRKPGTSEIREYINMVSKAHTWLDREQKLRHCLDLIRFLRPSGSQRLVCRDKPLYRLKQGQIGKHQVECLLIRKCHHLR